MRPAAGGRQGASARGSEWRRQLRRTLTYHRRLLSAGLAAGAVAIALTVLAPSPPPTVHVVLASADLPAGHALSSDDIRVAAFPKDAVPGGAFRSAGDVLGRVVAAPVREGEPLVDVRLMGPDLLAGQPAGVVAAPVRIADPSLLSLVRPGNVVDVLAAETTISGASASVAGAHVVAEHLRVLAVAPADPDSAAAVATGATLLLVAATSTDAVELARAAVGGAVSVTLRGREPTEAARRESRPDPPSGNSGAHLQFP